MKAMSKSSLRERSSVPWKKLSMYAIGRTVSIRSDDPVSGTLTAETNDNSIVNDKTRAMRLGKSAQDPTPEQVRAWRLADLATPLPWLTAETSASFLPQSLAMETNGGLSYTKGCFPGQEIIARVHYLGQAKYHLMGFEFELPRPLEQDPETIQLQSSAVPNESPTIITISCVPSGNYLVGLAVAPIQIQASHPVTCFGSGLDPFRADDGAGKTVLPSNQNLIKQFSISELKG